MKKFIAMLEDLWVAIAFAEAGVTYEPAASAGFATPLSRYSPYSYCLTSFDL